VLLLTLNTAYFLSFVLSSSLEWRAVFQGAVPIAGLNFERRIEQKCADHARWLSAYADFHSDSLAFQNDQQQFPRYLNYRCAHNCGGHGDRLHGMITVFLLAVLTNRTFLASMSVPADLQTIFVAGAINWMSTNYIRSNSTLDLNWINFLRKDKTAGQFDFQSLLDSPTSANFITISMNTDIIPMMFKPHGKEYDDTWYGNRRHYNRFLYSRMDQIGIPRDDYVQACSYNALFRPSASVRRQIQITLKQNPVPPSPYIAIHVRAGGTSRNKFGDSRRIKQNNWPKAWAAGFEMEKRLGLAPNTSHWFIASDDLLVMELARQIRGDMVFFRSQQPLHVDRCALNNVNSLRGFVNTAVDWYLLAGADALLMCYSQFSYTARRYGLFAENETIFWHH
jgi:hypothetical protein